MTANVSTCWAKLFRRVQLLAWGLDHRDRRDLDVGKLATHLLGSTDVDVLYDIAGRGVDFDRAARAARILPSLEELHRLVGSELAVGRLDQVKHCGHAVPGVDRLEIRVGFLAVLLVPGRDEGLVGRSIAGGRIGARGND